MANWYGAARTNYVTLTDVVKVKFVCETFDMGLCTNDVGKYAFFPSEDTNGDFNYSVSDENGDEIEFSWETEILPFVAEGEVLVVMTSGAEKLRYITGSAEAYCRVGAEVKSTYINLRDIYKQAAKVFDIALEAIVVAEY